MPLELLPLTVVIPTRNRAAALRRTLESLAAQSSQPAGLIIVDASENSATRSVCVEQVVPGLGSDVSWDRADVAGAAAQRNQGVRASSQSVMGFMDDDILFEPLCFARLWSALQSDPQLGGVNALITNQRCQTPGRIMTMPTSRPEMSVFWWGFGQKTQIFRFVFVTSALCCFLILIAGWCIWKRPLADARTGATLKRRKPGACSCMLIFYSRIVESSAPCQ